MKALLKLGIILPLLASTCSLHAQMPGANPSEFNTVLLKLFGKHDNFSVRAEMRMLDPKQNETMRLSFDMAVLEGKLRADVNTADAKGSLMTPDMIAQLKSLGMDRATSIIRPDKGQYYLIYPSLKSYAEVVLPGQTGASKSQPKMQKTPLGKETIDGHPCTKNKVVMTDEKGRKHESIAWEATDLKEFPLQLQMVEEGNTIVIRYKSLNLSKPDAKQFEPPLGYTKYADLESMVMKIMMGKAKPGP